MSEDKPLNNPENHDLRIDFERNPDKNAIVVETYASTGSKPFADSLCNQISDNPFVKAVKRIGITPQGFLEDYKLAVSKTTILSVELHDFKDRIAVMIFEGGYAKSKDAKLEQDTSATLLHMGTQTIKDCDLDKLIICLPEGDNSLPSIRSFRAAAEKYGNTLIIIPQPVTREMKAILKAFSTASEELANDLRTKFYLYYLNDEITYSRALNDGINHMRFLVSSEDKDESL